jgi:hypothetical protein
MEARRAKDLMETIFGFDMKRRSKEHKSEE